MRGVVSVLLIGTLVLTSCSAWRESRANPSNWFGKSKSAAVETRAQTSGPIAPDDRQTNNPLIDTKGGNQLVRRNVTTIQRTGLLRRRNKEVPYEGTLVDEVTSLDVERTPTGAIVHVTGLPNREGAFDVRLLRVNLDGPVDGVLEYTLNAVQPIQTRVGTQRTREVKAGAFVSNALLEEVREIRVRAERNVRSTRR
ncbi:MAG: hypothetical protein AAFN80_11240 [Pseudomonadota bacterium]